MLFLLICKLIITYKSYILFLYSLFLFCSYTWWFSGLLLTLYLGITPGRLWVLHGLFVKFNLSSQYVCLCMCVYTHVCFFVIYQYITCHSIIFSKCIYTALVNSLAKDNTFLYILSSWGTYKYPELKMGINSKDRYFQIIAIHMEIFEIFWLLVEDINSGYYVSNIRIKVLESFMILEKIFWVSGRNNSFWKLPIFLH